MNYSKLPHLNISGFILAIALGTIAAVAIYQVQVRGLIPGLNLSSPKTNLETRTILTEENAVISAVDKASFSVVAIGSGSGFVAASNLIVTNKHLVSEEKTYTISTKDGQKYEVRKIYKNPDFDLAIVQIDPNNLKPLELGDSSKLRVGQTVIAMGGMVTTGIVSSSTRSDLIQTDALINLSNSGGPLLNSTGQVIGINVTQTPGFQGGFAIPINSAKQIVQQFSTQGFISRPYLGIQYKFISQGAYIQDVAKGGPADKAGIKQGDIITQINDQTIDAENKVAEIVSKANIGTHLELTVWRDGKEIKLTAILVESTSQ